jgi:hypothetical protein
LVAGRLETRNRGTMSQVPNVNEIPGIRVGEIIRKQ